MSGLRGEVQTVSPAVLRCLWYGVFGPQVVQVVFVRERSKDCYDIALVSTDLEASAAGVVKRYAARWSIEVAIVFSSSRGARFCFPKRLAVLVGYTKASYRLPRAELSRFGRPPCVPHRAA